MPRINFGVPYKGSKNLIANKIVDILPTGNTLYDVFAGGCAITHCACLRHKYYNYVVNDLNDVPSLFVRAFIGEKFGKEWISRKTFFLKKDLDPYIRMCWSFGNNGRDYIYSQAIEPYKKALHYAVMFGRYARLRKLCPEVADYVQFCLSRIPLENTKERRIQIGKLIVAWLKEHGTPEMIKCNPLYKQVKCKRSGREDIRVLQSLQSLERLERLESLERLERLERLETTPFFKVYQKDYRKLIFNDPNGVIYCDPPYRNTDGYKTRRCDFDYNAFYLWCEQQTLPVYISEYSMPEDRFLCIAEFEKQSTLCATKSKKVIERLYRPWAQLR